MPVRSTPPFISIFNTLEPGIGETICINGCCAVIPGGLCARPGCPLADIISGVWDLARLIPACRPGLLDRTGTTAGGDKVRVLGEWTTASSGPRKRSARSSNAIALWGYDYKTHTKQTFLPTKNILQPSNFISF